MQNAAKTKPASQVRIQVDRAMAKEQEKKKTNRLTGSDSIESSKVKNEMKKVKE